MNNNDRLSQITTCIPTELKQRATELNIRYSEATVLGLNVLIKQKEQINNVIENGGFIQ